MKDDKRYYAVAAFEGVGIYDDYLAVKCIRDNLLKDVDREIISCNGIYEAKRTAINNYNLFQEVEENPDAIVMLNYYLPLNRFLYRQEIKAMRGGF